MSTKKTRLSSVNHHVALGFGSGRQQANRVQQELFCPKPLRVLRRVGMARRNRNIGRDAHAFNAFAVQFQSHDRQFQIAVLRDRKAARAEKRAGCGGTDDGGPFRFLELQGEVFFGAAGFRR